MIQDSFPHLNKENNSQKKESKEFNFEVCQSKQHTEGNQFVVDMNLSVFQIRLRFRAEGRSENPGGQE